MNIPNINTEIKEPNMQRLLMAIYLGELIEDNWSKKKVLNEFPKPNDTGTPQIGADYYTS